jgi:hypothetical protein
MPLQVPSSVLRLDTYYSSRKTMLRYGQRPTIMVLQSHRNIPCVALNENVLVTTRRIRRAGGTSVVFLAKLCRRPVCSTTAIFVPRNNNSENPFPMKSREWNTVVAESIIRKYSWQSWHEQAAERLNGVVIGRINHSRSPATRTDRPTDRRIEARAASMGPSLNGSVLDQSISIAIRISCRVKCDARQR